MTYEYTHARPVITADVILWCEDQGVKYVALIRRGKEPFKEWWALPGGHFDIEDDPDIITAAVRELREELGVDVGVGDVDWFDYYDQKNRDPRGRYIDHVFTCQVRGKLPLRAGDDADAGAWFSEQAIKALAVLDTTDVGLAFDHSRILSDFFEVMKEN